MVKKRITLADHRRELAELAFEKEVDRVYEEREFAFEALRSESWKQRYATLSLLHHHWHIDAEILVPICRIAFKDDVHIQVRQNALGVLGSLFEYTFDPVISSYLARIVLDASCPNRARRSACDALEKIRTEQPMPRQFQNVEFSDLLESVEQLKSGFEELKYRVPDELPIFNQQLMEELAREA